MLPITPIGEGPYIRELSQSHYPYQFIKDIQQYLIPDLNHELPVLEKLLKQQPINQKAIQGIVDKIVGDLNMLANVPGLDPLLKGDIEKQIKGLKQMSNTDLQGLVPLFKGLTEYYGQINKIPTSS